MIVPNGAPILIAPIMGSRIAGGENVAQTIKEINHQPSSGNDWKITEPTPAELMREVKQALPFERRDAEKRYVDLQIVWEGRLDRIYHKENKWEITAFVDKDYHQMAFDLTTVSPELRTATEGSVLMVKGKIEYVSEVCVELQGNPEVRLIRRA